jgi:hypothetical protein
MKSGRGIRPFRGFAFAFAAGGLLQSGGLSWNPRPDDAIAPDSTAKPHYTSRIGERSRRLNPSCPPVRALE